MADASKPSGTSSFRTGTGTHNYSHADFTYVRKKRGHLTQQHEGEEEGGELNIVPYLDIIINLIMFLLVAQATMVSLGMIDVTAPSYAKVGPGDTPPSNEGDQLRLTVGIGRDGFYIAAKGGVLPGQETEGESPEVTKDGVQRTTPTIPMLANGSYDFPTLTAKLRSIKTAFPKTEAVYIAADDSILYQVIVKTLDATREDARGPLFPTVAFTQLN